MQAGAPATVTHLLHGEVPWCFSACVSIHHVCARRTKADPLKNKHQSVIGAELSLTSGWPWHYSDGDCLTNKHFRFTSAGCSQCCGYRYISCIRGHLEMEKKGELAGPIKRVHWCGKHTVISLQKSYNGCKHNSKVAVLPCGEFAECVEQKISLWPVSLRCSGCLPLFDSGVTQQPRATSDWEPRLSNKDVNETQKLIWNAWRRKRGWTLCAHIAGSDL